MAIPIQQHDPENHRSIAPPRLTLRIALIGGFSLLLFAMLFFRLWYLQVLSGDEYRAQANNNRVREIRVQAPRGQIVDRNGKLLVDNRVAMAVEIEPRKLPVSNELKKRLYHRLSNVLGMSASHVQHEVIQQRKALPYGNVIVKTDVPRSIYSYLLERQTDFPGVTVRRIFLRHYPHKQLAAHIFGSVGEIGPDELKSKHFAGVTQGTIIGKGGVEYTYDSELRGRDGAVRVLVDSFGRPKGELAVREPDQGRQLRLALDMNLEKSGYEALAKVGAVAGAFVAVDPLNGEVLAMGSWPSFDPNLFSKPVEPEVYKRLNSEENGAPLLNRAIAGTYPTGSTFKVISAWAALESNVITPDTVVNDTGSFQIGGVTLKNAGGAAYGSVSLRSALQVSSDVYFYQLGAWADAVKGSPLQTYAHRLGIGRPTGIDLPGEFSGLLPTPKWRNKLFAKKLTDRPWSTGDSVNLAIGQGDLLANPLQMAVAYSALVNGGEVIQPHLAQEVDDSSGTMLADIKPVHERKVQLSEAHRQAIMDGLHMAATADSGTSAHIFGDFGRPIYGKTGTAETSKGDQAWYVAYASDPKRPIVIAMTVEQGGFGAETAAPAVRYMFDTWFGFQHQDLRRIKGAGHE